MKNFILFFILAFFAFSAKADTFFLYGALQAQRDYTELGYGDSGEVRYVHDFERSAYGAGAEWRFAHDGDFFFGAEALWQHAIKVKQNTTFLTQDQDPSSFTSRDDLQHISFLHARFNIYREVEKNLKFFMGIQYTFPDVRSHGRFDKYRVSGGPGYRTGIEMDLSLKWRSQIYYRHVVLDTEDKAGYEGEINISSLMLSLGYEF